MMIDENGLLARLILVALLLLVNADLPALLLYVVASEPKFVPFAVTALAVCSVDGTKTALRVLQVCCRRDTRTHKGD